ncbi:MAG: TIR domain-containing protein [Vicinamibacterales bacterium]
MSVFVSFDYDNDRYYKFLLEAWHANPRFRFTFQDGTPSEINSTNVGRVKAAITTKIQAATHTLVIVGQYANTPHRHRALIGHRNWINFEIAQSKAAYNRIVAVKLDRSYESPHELVGANATWAMVFTEEAIVRALSEA